MIKLILLSLFIFQANAEEVSCDISVSAEAEKLAENFVPQDCLSGINLRQLNKAFLSDKDRENVCKKCSYPLANEKITNKDQKQKFIKIGLDELKKGLSQTMLELMSIRSTLELNIIGEDIAKACDIQRISKDKSCEKYPYISEEINIIQRSLANEFASFYNPKITDPGLMDKTINNSCMVNDKDVLFIKNKYVEDSLPELVSVLKKFKKPFNGPNFTNDLNDALISLNKNIDITSLWNHPILSSLLKKPDALKAFIDKSGNDSSSAELRSRLYKEGSSVFGDELTTKCNGYVETFKNSICGDQVSKDNFAIDTKSGIEAVNDSPVSINSPFLEKTKEGMINFCQDTKFKNLETVKFSKVQEALSYGVPASLKDVRYSVFKSQAYNDRVSNQRDMICKIEDGSANCEKGSQICEMYKIWKESQNPESKDFKLLGAHDQNIDKILRALIGKPAGLSENTTKVLIAQGIYPDPITKQYATSDIPERKTDYYKTEAAQASISPVTSGEVNAKAPTASSPKPKQQSAPTQVSSGYSSPSTTTAPVAIAPNPDYDAEEDIRNDLQKKILDRLDNQISAEKIEEMVARAYNKGREQRLTPEQVKEKTREVLEEMPDEMPSMTSSGNGSSPAPGGKASVSRNAAKEKKAQKL